MSNYNYDALESNVAFRGTVASTQKVICILHVHKLEYRLEYRQTNFSIFFLFVIENQITSQLLIVFRNALKATSYTNLNVLYRK